MLELQITQTRHPLCILDGKMPKFNTLYAKFEYKGMKTFGVKGYTNKVPQKCFGWTDVLRFLTVNCHYKFMGLAPDG